MLYYNKYKWLGVFFMQKDEYCNWFMTNHATDGTKGYKTDCGCFFVIKKDEPVEDTDVCDCGKRIMLHD